MQSEISVNPLKLCQYIKIDRDNMHKTTQDNCRTKKMELGAHKPDR